MSNGWAAITAPQQAGAAQSHCRSHLQLVATHLVMAGHASSRARTRITRGMWFAAL